MELFDSEKTDKIQALEILQNFLKTSLLESFMMPLFGIRYQNLFYRFSFLRNLQKAIAFFLFKEFMKVPKGFLFFLAVAGYLF